jgi:hypothetical protein
VVAQLRHSGTLQSQLWAARDTRDTPSTYPKQLPKLKGAMHAAAPHTFVVPPPPHDRGGVQTPQLATVRAIPQLSAPETDPQSLPRRWQNMTSGSAMQPHTFAIPPPPHVCGGAQVPQLGTVRATLQSSVPVTLPQFFWRREQNMVFVSPVQPHTLGVPPPPQVCGGAHVPQLETVRAAPQLSLSVTMPQFFTTRLQKSGSDSAMQSGPHTLSTFPPPHVCGAVQVPQFSTVRVMPQESTPAT